MTRSSNGCENNFSIMERDAETRSPAPKNRQHVMENFVKDLEPVIKAIIRRYQPHIRGYEFEDLMQEGYAAALVAAKVWKPEPGKAGIKPWVWLMIKYNFNRLSQKTPRHEVFFEDLDMEIGPEEYEQDQLAAERSAEEDREEIIAMLFRSLPKYRNYLEAVLEESLINAAAARNLGLSRQRINQLQNEIRKVFTDFRDSDC